MSEQFNNEEVTATLTLDDDTELECGIIGVFEVDGKEYIALLPVDDETVLIYEYTEKEDGDMELGLIEKYRNIDTKQVKLYNDSLGDTSIELQPEEPVCAQELYGEIDKMIQQILTDENTDIAAMVKKANDDFQKNYLNNLD